MLELGVPVSISEKKGNDNMRYYDIKQIKITRNVDEVNELLISGWRLVDIFQPDVKQAPLFVLGKF